MTAAGSKNGWDASAEAWIAEQGEHGDFGRRFVLDPVMLARLEAGGFKSVLDVGCGEGRFARLLRRRGYDVIGVEPTGRLLEEARARDPEGDYRQGVAERLDFADASVDLVLAYLTLIDIEDARGAIAEAARVLKPGGAFLIANLTGFTSAAADVGWLYDESGAPLHYRLDRYLEARPIHVAWRGIDIVNWHRPLGFYMEALLRSGLTLAHFDEPAPVGGPEKQAARYRRVPYFVVMEWRKPRGGDYCGVGDVRR